MAYLDSELNEILNRGYKYALSLTNDKNDSFDLVQSSYLKIVEKNKPLIISYLITTIRNLFIDNKRKEKLKLNWIKMATPKTSYKANFTTEPYLEKILSQLSTRNREIIFLSILEEYTAQEISDLMKIPRGTILSILSRTKQKLKIQLNEKTKVV